MLDDKLYLIGVGLEKSGTSTLHAILSQTAQIEAPRLKEPHFFFRMAFAKGFDYYNNLFDPRPGALARIDFTPTYGFGKGALANIRDFPIAKKIIVTLRHPIDRAFSRYAFRLMHFHRMAVDLRYMADVVDGENRRRDFLNNPIDYSFYDLADRALASRGSVDAPADRDAVIMFPSYSDLVEICFDYFGRDNVLVLLFDEWIRHEPAYITGQIARFAGIALDRPAGPMPHGNPTYLPGFAHIGPDGFLGQQFPMLRGRREPGRRSYMIVDGHPHDLASFEPEIADRLIRAAAFWTDHLSAAQAEKLYQRLYRDDITRLEGLLGQDLSGWRRFRDLRYPRHVI